MKHQLLKVWLALILIVRFNHAQDNVSTFEILNYMNQIITDEKR